MATDQTTYEKIESYLSGEMTEAEQEVFTAEMETDAELKETVALYRSLNDSYTDMEQSKAGEQDLRKTMQDISGNYFSEKKEAKVFSMKRTYKMMAVAASLVVAFLLLQPLLFQKGSKNLFDTYYEQESLSVERGETDSILKAVMFFNKKEYTQAILFLEPITLKNKEANDLILAKGESYLHLNRFEKAMESFETVIATGSVYAERATWLKAMTLLKQDKKPECRNFLSSIKENSSYYKKAQQLLKELNK